MHEEKIRENFEERLKDVLETFEEFKKDYPKLINKCLELYTLSTTEFYSVFHKAVSEMTRLETLEGMENFCSVISNFFDDAYFSIDKEDCLIWSNDSTEYLDEDSFIEYLNRKIRETKKKKRKFEGLFGKK